MLLHCFVSCRNPEGRNRKEEIDLYQVSEVVRSVFSFSYSLIFMTYIFLKVNEFAGRCAQLDEEGLLSINCEFDIRTVSSSGIRAEGECIIPSDYQNIQEGTIYLQNCGINVVSENFSAEIYGGDVRVKGLGVFFKKAGISVTVPELPLFFSMRFPEAQAEIKSVHAGESLRNFQMSGKGIIDNTMEIEVEKLYVQDKGQGEVYILPDGNVKVSGCLNKAVEITPLSGNFISFDIASGCPKDGDITYEGEKIYFDNGKIIYSGENFDCSSSVLECPFLIF